MQNNHFEFTLRTLRSDNQFQQISRESGNNVAPTNLKERYIPLSRERKQIVFIVRIGKMALIDLSDLSPGGASNSCTRKSLNFFSLIFFIRFYSTLDLQTTTTTNKQYNIKKFGDNKFRSY